MQYFRRSSFIRVPLRFLSSIVVDVTPATVEKELFEINKLMQSYNSTIRPIRTAALFEWMLNIINVKPNFTSYLHVIRACGELNNMNMCRKIHHYIDNDSALDLRQYHQLQIKLIYMYAKMKNIELAEELFQQIKSKKDLPINIKLFGTMFKGYNMNRQPRKTIELYENEVLNQRSIELDAQAATCILIACSDCNRLDIGEYVHGEIQRQQLLNPPNIRLATAIMDMYCHCGSIERAREIFDEFLPIADRVAYLTLMQAYLSANQPLSVLSLFKQLQSSSVTPNAQIYTDVISACSQLGLRHQAENVHRLVPSNIIERNHSVLNGLIDMHAHCFHLNEAHRLFNLQKENNNNSLASLLHGFAINGEGRRALNLFDEIKNQSTLNEHVYRMILYACAFTGDLVDEARKIYTAMPDRFKTTPVMAAMVSTLVRASLFNEAETFIHQNKARSKDLAQVWTEFFLACYHSNNVDYAQVIYDEIVDNPFLLLLHADMTNSLLSKEIKDYFRQQPTGRCWTEIENVDKTDYIIYEFRDDDLSPFRSLQSEIDTVIKDLKLVGVNWEPYDNDCKELFCGHTALRLAIVKNLVTTLSSTSFQLTKTKPICHVCHEGIKQLSLLKQRDFILRDDTRVHRFQNGNCSCNDQF